MLAGAQAPERLKLTITNAQLASEPLDLSTVTAVSLQVTRPSGVVVTWSTTIDTQTSTSLVVLHTFAAPDVPTAGEYGILILLTVPTGVRRAGPSSLQVTAA
jgi:hypothetical protein